MSNIIPIASTNNNTVRDGSGGTQGHWVANSGALETFAPRRVHVVLSFVIPFEWLDDRSKYVL